MLYSILYSDRVGSAVMPGFVLLTGGLQDYRKRDEPFPALLEYTRVALIFLSPRCCTV
jgi:hypothetical protein